MVRLKAYAAQEDCERTGGIVFAATAKCARLAGAQTFGDGDVDCWRAARAPWADPCVETGVVPVSLMIENGWRFECCGCGETIGADWLDERGLPLSGVIGDQGAQVFCCKACQLVETERNAEQKAAQTRIIGILSDIVRARFPDADIVDEGNNKPHAYVHGRRGGPWIVDSAVVSFKFQGMTIAPAQLRLERPHNARIGPVAPRYSVCAGDREAFEAWARQHPKREAA
jgi:hypothetical protein